MLVRFTYRNSQLQHTNGCATLVLAYLCMLQLEDHLVAVHLWVCTRKCSLCWLPPPTESLEYHTYIGVQIKSSLCWLALTVVHYTYGSATFSAAHVAYLYIQNHCLTLHLWVRHLKGSLSFDDLPRQSLGYTAPMGVEPSKQPMLINSTYTITVLHQSYGCPILIAAHVGYVYLPNHQVTLHIWVSKLKCSLCWLALLSESMVSTLPMGVHR